MEFKDQVKASSDIVSVAGQYVRLKRIGSTQRYLGLCPFHNEKTPSFNVHGNQQFYKCFGCGVGGDVFKFVQEMERVSFYEALKSLAERAGIPMPRRSEHTDAETRLRALVQQAHEVAAEAFQANLRGPAGAEARAYLAQRGVSQDMIDHFGLGYAERGGQSMVRLLQSHDFPADQWEHSGLVLKRQDSSGHFDRFRHRLMFPIHNESGKTIAFAGRALAAGDEPKYMNSPETPIYRKSYVLFNLHRAKDAIRKEERSVLVEGYMDVIGVYAAGVREVVASCGTALTPQQVQALKRHSERIVVNFDPDAAGAAAAERSIQILLDEGLHIRVLELAGGLDPDEYCKQHGAAAYRAVLDGAKNYFYWLADRARARFDMRTAEGRVAGFQFLLPSIQRLTDKIERVAVAGDVAGYLGVDAGLVLEHFRKAAGDRKEQALRAPVEPLRFAEKALLRLLLDEPATRSDYIPRMRNLEAIHQFSTYRIFQAIFALYDAGVPFGFADLDARLEEPDRDRLAKMMIAGESEGEAFSLSQGEECLRSLEGQEKGSHISALRASIRDAERSGRLGEAMRLAEELDRMRRKG